MKVEYYVDLWAGWQRGTYLPTPFTSIHAAYNKPLPGDRRYRIVVDLPEIQPDAEGQVVGQVSETKETK